jgi:hypothetical protein
MKHKRILILAFLLLLILSYVAIVAIKSKFKYREADLAKSVDKSALMTVTSSGGMCAGTCNHPAYNLYETGKFEGHSKLTSSEVTGLKQTITVTNFEKYAPNPKPNCQSFVDGVDQVLFFPQKYGNKPFTVCMLDIPVDDEAFLDINKLIDSHHINKN